MTDAYDARAENDAADVGAELRALVEQRYGAPVDAAKETLIQDYARLERLKAMAEADVAARGMGRMETNGRQRYWKDNRNAVLILKYMDKQSRILKDLGLSRAASEAEPMENETEVDEFDDI